MPPPFPSLTKTWHTTTYPSINPTQPSLSLGNKIALITGGGTGIGAATAHSFAVAGVSHIALLGGTLSTLTASAHSIITLYPSVQVNTYVTSITSFSQLEIAINAYAAEVGKIDILISNAGTLAAATSIASTTAETFTDTIGTNLIGSFFLIKAFLPHAADGACVINVASSAAHMGIGPGFAGYCVAKAGAVRLFDALQEEREDLRVDSLQPGIVGTNLNTSVGLKGMDDSELIILSVQLIGERMGRDRCVNTYMKFRCLRIL
jgi:NAD(P)-dependent dehydrogenase (short-subunit alcohol dehydrogenase family)